MSAEFEDQIRQMIAALNAKRDQAIKQFNDAIRALEIIAGTIPPSVSVASISSLHERPKESAAARTRRIITLILKETGQPMNVSTIAERAHTTGVLASPRGYKGVYADVARVLIRNQHLFTKTGERGFWKLKEVVSAVKKVSSSTISDQETNRGLGIITGPPRPSSGPPVPNPVPREFRRVN